MDYTILSLAEVRAALDEVSRDTEAAFGALDARRLNWRPDPKRWSVAQCLEHLLESNRLMIQSAREALAHGPSTVWQRLPVLPGLWGPWMVRTLGPRVTRKFTSPPASRPAESDLPADVVQRFVTQHRETVAWLRGVDEGAAGRAIMASPFLALITYSVLDGCRLIAAHDRRHFEQARRVMTGPGFPAA